MNNHAEFGIETTHEWWCAKRLSIPAGIILPQHAHKYDHYSLLLEGTVFLREGNQGEWQEFSAPCPPILIKAGTPHKLMTITNAVWICAHDVDMALFDQRDPDKVDESVVM
jgi:quercetin dioxygenase-like cupin family protein